MAASEVVIRSAERARLQSLVDEFGSESEQNHLVISGWQDGVADSELLARLARRVERRANFGLPVVECAGEPATHGCTCLELALDEAGGRGKQAVLRLAAGFHWSPPPRREQVLSEEVAPAPQEASAEPREATERVETPSPQPAPTRKPAPPFRIVRRTRKWFDPVAESFRDMKF